MFSLKDIKFPLVSRKKLEKMVTNNKIINRNRMELSKQNVELQKKVKALTEQVAERDAEISLLKIDNEKLEEKLRKKKEKQDKEVVVKHCVKCGRFFRVTSVDSHKKYCQKCRENYKKEKKK